MGYYQRNIAPRVVDLACSSKGMVKWRQRCVEDLTGIVVEVGFGAGRNLDFYPATLDRLIAVEPSAIMRERGASRAASAAFPFEWGGLDGQRLDLPDDSVDAAVVTFALCTIPDAEGALRELRRVVRAGGELRVLEHGLAPDESVRKWQRRLNPIEKRVADGCQLIREPVAMVEASGWKVTSLYQRYTPGPKPWTYFTSLRAS